ncbi:DNAJ domain-containing protein Mdj1 [Schizosaccharomyces japonicus yFS275]|uniref:DnaJ homolog 1, mitochondrial n=1 Tax=Schizosaccharomyces japonicus (strain yFS275 / FY16936) TaxID=402676 RepID=B6JXC5_SCHJY|nr:DNAJ domain-containing protein Mdj1 [Schizosaccharomyces japonicus yFS275]EEB06026.1 DNAJ domain-containing protein Mdj1 [Schizosaccharomyces japonicus yFS275]
MLRNSLKQTFHILKSCTKTRLCTQNSVLRRSFASIPSQTRSKVSNRLHKKLANTWGIPYVRSFRSSAPRLDPMKDPYATLGVDKNASNSDIKKAYYKLAKQYHPDANPDKKAQEKFVEIKQAYEILSDPQKKQAFDSYGPSSFSNGEFNGSARDYEQEFRAASNGFGGFGGFGGFNFEDLFSGFTGSARQSRRSSAFEVFVGEDIDTSVTIDFLEAAKGTRKNVTIRPLTTCSTCHGTGLKTGTSRQTCSTCNGTGHRVHVMQGGFQMATACQACGGVGTVIPPSGSCRTCGGEGVIRERKVVAVDIPAGIQDGMHLRIQGQGDAASTANAAPNARSRPGDLFVTVRIRKHELFRRDGANVYYQAKIPMTTAILGGTITVPTLDGEVELRVPPSTNTGEHITMSGKGMPKLTATGRSGYKGDFLVEFQVSMPKSLTPEQRHLMEMLADSLHDTTARRTGITGNDSKPSTSTDTNENNQNGSVGGFFKRAFRRLHPEEDTKNKTDKTDKTDKADKTDEKK